MMTRFPSRLSASVARSTKSCRPSPRPDSMRSRSSRTICWRLTAAARGGCTVEGSRPHDRAFQPFRDFEGMAEVDRARKRFRRAERKFDLMQELGTRSVDGLLATSRPCRSAESTAPPPICANWESAPLRAGFASASKRWPGADISMTIAMRGRSCVAPTIPPSASCWTASIRSCRTCRCRRSGRFPATGFF